MRACTSLRGMAFATVVVAGLGLAGCGKQADTTPKPVVAEEPEEEAEPVDASIDQESYDQVTRAFEARRMQVARCYSDALEAGKIDKKAKGRVTFEMTITAGGRARNVKQVKDELGSPEVIACAIALIESWELPQPAASMPFSFGYQFEEQ